MFDEIGLMQRLQAASGSRGASLARGYSLWGEHALGWMGLGLAGAVVDRSRRRQWLSVTGAAFVAHGSAVVLKRVVRRRRPFDERIVVRVKAPSDLSFPSAHVSSTTAAAVALTPIVGAPAAAAAVGAMALARVSLGVHYPSDVVAAAALGLGSGLAVRRLTSRGISA
jgi:membrane-associated phospholipid phosphatase